jgi:hypothetical protein
MIKKTAYTILVLLMLPSISFADKDISELAKELNLYAGTKASIQWERIFSSERRLKRYNLDELQPEKLIKLRNYLIKHSADSKQPVVPGL